MEDPTQINNLLAFNNNLYFSADDGEHGDEMWISNGTTVGTYLLKDINESNPGVGSTINFMTPDLSKFYFVANDGIHGNELWVSNGTTAGTYMVKDMDPWDDTQLDPNDPLDLEFIIEELIIWNGYLYFAGYDGNGVELWRTTGTDATTIQVTDIDGTSANSRVTRLVLVDDWIYMGATDRTMGRRLWKHNGVVGAAAIYIEDNLADDGRDVDPKRLLKAGEHLYYSSSDGIHGRELWVTDGVTAEILKDIFPAGSYGITVDDPSPRDCIDIKGKLFFSADDYTYGLELWRSEGTEETTVRVTNINPSGGIEFTEDVFLVLDDVYYFSATDGSSSGKELWAINIIRFTTQPVASTVALQGESGVSLSAAGLGEGLLSYQWQHDGINIEGETASTLNFSALTLEDSGTYNCVLSDVFYGDLLSANSVLTVQESDIKILEQPAALSTACPGDPSIILSVVAEGVGILIYQWKFNDIEITGATLASLELTNDVANSGTYTCILSDVNDTVSTNEAVVTIFTGTEITTQPISTSTACEGDESITLSIEANGSGTLIYQWKLNGTDIPDTDSTSIVIQTEEANSGVYTCLVSGDCEATSDSALVTINPATILTVQPNPLTTVCEGESEIVLLVEAYGAGTLTYQWKYNDIILEDSVSTSLVIQTVESNSGTYNCTVIGDCGEATSENAFVTVIKDTVIITTQPEPLTTFCEVDSAIILSVEATGAETLNYQWKLNGINIPDAISPTLALTSHESSSGTYTCLVSADCEEATTDDALVFIHATTVINTQPEAITKSCEADVEINLTVEAYGSGTLTYQWKKDGTIIAGAVSPTLAIPTFDLYNGDYTCVVTGDCGEVISNVALVKIFDSTKIIKQPESVSNICADESDVILYIIADGAGTVSYQWKKDDIIINGANSTSLVLDKEPTSNGKYTCTVNSDCGDVTSNNVIVEILSATKISGQPEASTMVCEGDEDITLSVNASGTGDITYQWKLGNSEINGAISATLLIEGDVSKSGIYTCEVTSDCGKITSNDAVVTVVPITTIITQPIAETNACEGDNDITLEVVPIENETLTYQWKKNDEDITGATSHSLVIETDFINSGSYSCVVSGNCGVVTSANAIVNITAATEITTQPKGLTNVCSGDANITIFVNGGGTGSITYQWMKEEYIINGATSRYLIISTNPASSGTYTCIVNSECGAITSDDAVVQINEIIITKQANAETTICANDANVELSVEATGTGDLMYQWKLDNVEITGANSTTLAIESNVSNSGIYTCSLTDDCGTVTSKNAEVIINSATEIISQPEAFITVNQGDPDIIISVGAIGTGTLTYQWKFDNIAIYGANSANLIVEAKMLSNGTYSCLVQSNCGEITSEDAVVFVNEATYFSTQPAAITSVCQGDAEVMLSVVASGSENVYYQWSLNDIEIPSSNSESITILTDSCFTGIYTCFASSECGEATSTDAIITINPETVITAHPVSKENIENGIGTTFSVLATGADLIYKWIRNGEKLIDNNNVSGSSTELLSIASVSGAYEGEYKCEITGSCGIVTSNMALLSIENTTSIHDLTNLGVLIFPNPSKGKFTIQFDKEIDEAVVVVYDLVGKILYRKNVISNNFLMDISDNAKGVYILKIEVDKKLITSKLILE